MLLKNELKRFVALLKDVVRTRGRGLKNVTARGGVGKVLVLESDDWGSQRVPSKKAREDLLSCGILSGRSAYDWECLEGADDLHAVSETLKSIKGADGKAAVMTCFINPANPDFRKIRESGFESYHWEPTRAIHERRGDWAEVREAWEAGVAASVLERQYHGREHLQVRSWMESLRRGDAKVCEGFDLGYYSVALDSAKPVARGFRAAYLFSSFDEIPELEDVIVSGARLFQHAFGHAPEIFCTPNNVFHRRLYKAVREAGCQFILRHTHNLEPDGKGGAKNVWGQPGVREAGLIGYGRNALFEPEQGFGISHTLGQIESAFAWGVPAIISTHRVNYIGGIDPGVRERGNAALGGLLREVLKRWPEVRFLSSRCLLEELSAHG